jgi:hypothetical protein
MRVIFIARERSERLGAVLLRYVIRVLVGLRLCSRPEKQLVSPLDRHQQRQWHFYN